ncbi:VWFA domain-containing protein [Aphelenchoides besseyi]|nr:VWFA domain-containing protein [Aphelenchoides besseyi]
MSDRITRSRATAAKGTPSVSDSNKPKNSIGSCIRKRANSQDASSSTAKKPKPTAVAAVNPMRGGVPATDDPTLLSTNSPPSTALTTNVLPPQVAAAAACGSNVSLSLSTTTTQSNASTAPTVIRKAEIVFSFDTTASMYACLGQCRRKIKECAERLFREIGTDHLRIGITAHGDYLETAAEYGYTNPYVTKHLPLTTNVNTIVDFVENVEATWGGYELVLHEAQQFAWSDNWSHVLVLIGDDVAHEKSESKRGLDWKEELDKLKAMNVVVHSVQALNRRHANEFYAECAKRTNGVHMKLDQFASVVDLVMAVCYRESAQRNRLEQYEQEVRIQPGRYNRALRSAFDQMLGRSSTTAVAPGDMNACQPGRFQVMEVDTKQPIKEFVRASGIPFEKGRGFYEFTKPETVQKYKEIIIMDKATGDLF